MDDNCLRRPKKAKPQVPIEGDTNEKQVCSNKRKS